MRKSYSIRMISALMAMLVSACSGSNGGTYVGYVEAELVYVAPPEAGWLVAAPLREGDMAARGSVLFELDDDRQRALNNAAEANVTMARAQAANIETGARPQEIQALRAQLTEAEAARDLAKAERDRWLPLVAEGNASPARGDQVVADFEAAQARVNAAKDAIEVAQLGGRDAERVAADAATQAAEATRDEARWRLGQRAVTAKVAGRVEEVFHREGEFVSAGSPVLALLPENAIKVRFFVPQDEKPKFTLGADVNLHADGVATPVTARISFIAREAEFTPPVIYSVDAREKLVFLVEARPVDPAGLRPGLPVDVLLP